MIVPPTISLSEVVPFFVDFLPVIVVLLLIRPTLRFVRSQFFTEQPTELDIQDFADSLLIDSQALEMEFENSGSIEAYWRFKERMDIIQELGMFLDRQKELEASK
ncbi:hypothetical protein [Cerasicoccus fimbriatus]|uniref:hypothetical protein n=1 Tax=Cerasicoccus fimbriatus TaxID=3014554 RepID=UPI0022B511D8|nr:hypothetical protein [Cerasicoccus sp. TK19100]